jgi:hypothetical protein
MDSECQPLEHKVYGRYETPIETGTENTIE